VSGPPADSARTKVVIGLKAHSGWAALVALGFGKEGARIVDRRRIDLFEPGGEWLKAPYHAAEELEPSEARRLVERGVKAAHRQAARAMREAAQRIRELGHAPVACAVLTGAPMPSWTTAEILAVHFRMHKAEGALWRDVLAEGAALAGLQVVSVPEKELPRIASRVLGEPWPAIVAQVESYRAQVGPPWGRDQKDAAVAALVGRRSARRSIENPASGLARRLPR
jgi:hypothetical protein